MSAPEIFIELCHFFHQDIMVVYPNLDAALRDFFTTQTPADISDLTVYLNGRITSEEVTTLESEWDKLGADISFPDGGITAFYKAVLSHGKSP